jgi:multidrug efflux pump subunit AcrA (membrane-fusion protein)
MWIYRSAASVVVVASLVACQDSTLIPPTEPEATVESPAKPNVPDEQAPRVTTVAAPATIEAFFATDLYAKNAGYVSQINNDIGDHVKRGQLLATIEDPELEAQSNKAQATIGQTRATLDVAKRELAGMVADLELQRVTLERQKVLFAGRAATAQMLDEAQAKEDVSSATVETGKAKISLAEADLQAARAEANRLQKLLEYNKITAPFDGVVTRRLVNPGDLVQAATSTRTTPLFTCQKIDVVRVFAFVPESSSLAIHPGTLAEVKPFSATVPSIKGAVTRIAKALDPATRTMRVEIDLPNPDEKLRPGTYARVTLTIEQSNTGAAKPRLTDNGGPRRGTFVPANGAAAPSPDHE